MNENTSHFNFYGVDVAFPYSEPYPAQKSIMSNCISTFLKNENGLLESPTGTGKSLALLASSLAYSEYISKSSIEPGVISSANRIRIFYSSRTHHQLKQVINEYKRLSYSSRMSILASREKTCLNTFVLKTLSESSNASCVTESNSECPFKHHFVDLPTDIPVKFTIKDIKEYCSVHSYCPHFLLRELIKTSDIIFSPYDYIFSPTIRQQLQLDEKISNSILIIDEAHNIEDTCRNYGSYKLFRQKLQDTIKELNQMKESRVFSFLENSIDELLQYFSKAHQWMVNCRSRKRNEVEVIFDDAIQILYAIGVSKLRWNKISPHINSILNVQFHDSTLIIKRDLDKFLTGFNYFFSSLLLENTYSLKDFKCIFHFVKNDSEEDNDFLEILCLNPAISFRSISSAHSIILSSGTLSPLDSFESELGIPFSVKVSADHVITKAQLSVFIMSQSQKGVRLSSSYQYISRSDNLKSCFLALGESVLTIIEAIPDGVLMFVPSYKILEILSKFWRDNGIFQKMKKQCFIEEKKGDSIALAEKYKMAIDTGGNGAFLMAVCRAKLSEGVDFSDSQCRAVIVFGIPYPNREASEVKLKMQYNDIRSHRQEEKLMSGDDWYTMQAERSLFQSMGRCIRHAKDYGTIILIDDRFLGMRSRFPLWVQSSFRLSSKPIGIATELRTFFNQMESLYPVKQKRVVGGKPLDLVCSICEERFAHLQYLKPDHFISVEELPSPNFFVKENNDKNENGIKKALEISCLNGKTLQQKIVYVSPGIISTMNVDYGDEIRIENEKRILLPIVCDCGHVLGVVLDMASYRDQKSNGGMWFPESEVKIHQGELMVEPKDVVY